LRRRRERAVDQLRRDRRSHLRSLIIEVHPELNVSLRARLCPIGAALSILAVSHGLRSRGLLLRKNSDRMRD
jgi:hypothetical protein